MGHHLKAIVRTTILVPVPLSIFRSNSKFDENSERSSFEYTGPITTFCTRHDNGTVMTVQNIAVIGRVYFTLEWFEFSSNFEFNRNMLSGTGAWYHLILVKSLIQSLGTHIWYLGEPQTNLSNLAKWMSTMYQFNNPSNGRQGNMLYWKVARRQYLICKMGSITGFAPWTL